MKVWKDALYPGVWTLTNGKQYVCQPSDVGHFARRVKDMLATGYPMPACWAHQKKAVPGAAVASLSQEDQLVDRERKTFGHIHDARQGANGELELLVDATDPDDRKQLEKTKFVSPEIRWNFTDPRGKTWDGPSIVHLAAVGQPVQYPQKPFSFDPAKAISLSQAAYQEPVSLSQATYQPVRLGDGEMADDKPDTTASDSPAEGLETSKMKDVISALASLGLMIGDDTTAETLADRIIVAANTKMASEGQTPAAEPEPEPSAADLPGTEEMSSPVMMSQAIAQRDGARKEVEALKAQLAAEKKRADAAAAEIAKERRRRDAVQLSQAKKRIETLFTTGRIGPAVEKDLTAEWVTLKKNAQTVSLSQNGPPLTADPLFIRLDAYERNDANAAWGAVSLSQAADVTEHGMDDDKPDPQKLDDEVVNALTAGRWGALQKRQNGKK